MTRPAADDAAVRLWNSLGCPAWKLREIADAFAAALTERDQAWRAALAFALAAAATDETLAEGIRALLDPAGKGRTE